MTPNASDQEIRRRRLLGVGLRADLVSPADLARDISFSPTATGVDLVVVAGVDNLCQGLSVSLSTLRGTDVFNRRFGFLGLTPLTDQSSPVLAREGVRGAVAECVASDPRVRRIVDLHLGNPMAPPSGASRRSIDVRVGFEVVGGDVATLSSAGLASGASWGTVSSESGAEES